MRLTIVSLLMFSLVQMSYAQCVLGDCVNGYGEEVCDCGYTFKGTYKDSVKVSGQMIKKDYVYEGEFLNDMPHGQGKITYKDGSYYEGDFVESRLEGHGVYHEVGGYVYSGNLENNRYSGVGSLRHFDSLTMVETVKLGWFSEDRLDGLGVELLSSGDYYIGFYKKGRFHGLGSYYLAEEDELVMGEYKHGDIHDGDDHPYQQGADVEYTYNDVVKNRRVTFVSNEDGVTVSFKDATKCIVKITDDSVKIDYVDSAGELHAMRFNREGKILE